MNRSVLLLTIALFALPWAATPALAEPPPPETLDLTFRSPRDPDTWIRPSLRTDAAWFAGVNTWGGNAEEIIGDRTNGFAQLGLDLAGSNFYDGETRSPSAMTLEDFYVRWNSSALVPTLGKDAIELSVGAQPYQVGPGDLGQGFLFWEGGKSGGRRGGLWLAMRNAFQLTGIARVKTAELTTEGVYLRADEGHDVYTDIAGVNFTYELGERLNLEFARVGLGYWNIFDSDDARRDGLNVINARLDLKPCRCLPGLRFTGEMVKEKNGSMNDSLALWGELGHDFPDVPGSPFLSYRYAFFSGDDLGTEGDEAFDPLFYGLSDWNYWFIGEISGEWVTGNSNLHASIFRLGAHPTASLRTQFFWIYQRIDQLAGSETPPPGFDPGLLDVTNHNFSHEFNVIVDWAVNEHLTTTFVGAALVPLKGGEQYFGSDKTWGQFMVYWSVAL